MKSKTTSTQAQTQSDPHFPVMMRRICLMYRSAAPLCCALGVAGTAAQPVGESLFQESFENGLARWRPQGEGLRASVVKSDHDKDGMLRLDNSSGRAQAFFGVEAGPTDTLLRFSFFARSGLAQKCKVGLHRHAGAIKWADVDQTWRQVSYECRSHEKVPSWFIVVPAGGVVFVDTVELHEVKLTEAERQTRLAAHRAESERAALEAYQSTRVVRPAAGTSLDVHGKFPIGFYIVRTTSDRVISLDRIFAELSAAGVSLVHNSDFEDWPEHAPNYSEINSNRRATEYVTKALANGLGVLMGFDRMMVVKSSLAGMRERVAALKGQPGLWGWYLIDEPSINGASPDTTRLAYEAVREADGAHPVVITEFDTDQMRDYMTATDVMMTDAYPVSTSPLFTMVVLIERALSACEGKKPVWAAIQVHNDDVHKMKWGEVGSLITKPRPPTVDEVRCMAYLAIAHGASGLFFFAYDAYIYGKAYEDAARYEGIRQVTHEISGYSRELLGDCLAKGAIRGANGTLLSYIVRGRRKGNALLVAVNGFDRPSGPVRIPLSSQRAMTVRLGAHEVLVKRLTVRSHRDDADRR